MNTFKGHCHCGKVAFEVETDLGKVMECNCSHCGKKGFMLNFVDKAKFNITRGAEYLTDYLFGKEQIRHRFCKNCGTQAFAEGISFPQVAVNVRCLEGVEIEQLKPEKFNGRDL